MRNIIGNILTAAIAAVAVFFLVMSVSGHRFYVVSSGSMEPAIPTGSLVFVNTRALFSEAEAGDVVCFEAANGEPVIHRAVAVYPEGIETKGDANSASDGISTGVSNYVGTVDLHIPAAGYLWSFLSVLRVKIAIFTAIGMLAVISVYRYFAGETGKEKEHA